MAVVFLLSVAALPAGSSVPGPASAPIRLLQMNLCNSGMAGCYTGRSVTEASKVIRTEKPGLVALNEVCADDVDALERTMADVHAGGTVVGAFKAARNGRTGGPYRCLNGQPYGVGLLAHIPAPYRGHTVHSGIYPMQDATDPEERAWLCVDAAGALYACTTHLAYTSPVLALAQCGYLLGTAIPLMRLRDPQQPAVLSGDLNLRHGGSPDVRACVPSGYLHLHDGAVQQLMATGDFIVHSSRSVSMGGTTDHASFLVTLTVDR
ncbi:endonuclease/exonuclease/phosphatase family protein [Micromonospora sp. H33]|uniref:endonuclease/exonuclease/phosphatase family protein n=1 Tax=Micromonospora sp. H33 TaxID=3452215 RepID=UPI003F8C9BBA